jgi:hypothetical protein
VQLEATTQPSKRHADGLVYRGCVTPQQVANLQEESGKDTDMIDGYDELPAEYQHKVKYALDNGHVEDADWKWDIECNRVGTKGFRVKAPPKKKGKKTAEVREMKAY